MINPETGWFEIVCYNEQQADTIDNSSANMVMYIYMSYNNYV